MPRPHTCTTWFLYEQCGQLQQHHKPLQTLILLDWALVITPLCPARTPVLHGSCMNSAANYSSTTVHPPLIGFGRDGPSIYGRYLYTTSVGYTVALDDCGGHIHDGYEYHYHTMVRLTPCWL